MNAQFIIGSVMETAGRFQKFIGRVMRDNNLRKIGQRAISQGKIRRQIAAGARAPR